MVLRCDQFNLLRTQKVFLRAMLVPADKQSLAINFFAQKNIPLVLGQQGFKPKT